MKNALPATLLASLVAVGAPAQTFWSDPMNYPPGTITTNANSPWIRHSGSANDSFEVNYAGSGAALAGPRYEINQTRSDDIHRWFDPLTTNGISSGTVFASFVVSVATLPGNAGGTYFAHFMDTGTFFRGRVFAIVPSNPYPYVSALPGTFRLGVANAAGDAANGSNGPNVIIPIDLALNTDYQVVLRYDYGQVAATIWVNPASESDTANSSGATGDFGPATNALAAFAFRQSTGEGVLEVRDVLTGLNFADVVTNQAAVPVIGQQPADVTNYAGNPVLLGVAASGMGVLGYQWYKEGNPVSGATSPALVINSLQASDQGNYYCTLTNAAGATNSAPAYLSVNTTPTAPTFTLQPQNRTNSLGETLSLSALAAGTGPLSYQWQHYGTNISDGPSVLQGDASVVSGSQSPFLTIFSVSTNEGGEYAVIVSGGAGAPTTSSTAYVAVLPPRQVSIGFLRTLVDHNTWQPTDTTTLFSITGVITTFTNLTSGNTSSSYIQDETGGINLFISGSAAPAFRPQLGDVVTASGTLLAFNNNLELQCLTANAYQAYSILSQGAALPAPKVIPFAITNDSATSEALEGSLIMLTNVFFTNTATLGSGNTTITVTNSKGEAFLMFFPGSQDQDLRNKTLPPFAWTVVGTFSQFKSGAYSKAGYEINVTRFADIVTTAPPPVSAAAALSGNNLALSWIAVPYTYSYSVRVAADVAGPYLPLVTGLTFTNTVGSYLDSNNGTGSKFYLISSP